MTRAKHLLLPWLLAAFTACSPGNPSDGTGEATGGASGTSVVTDGSSETTEHADSGESASTGPEFACPDARWHEGDLNIDDATDLEALRDVGGVTGSLYISETGALVDLEFLSCLEVVEGTVSMWDNASLSALRGLERLRVINGNTEGIGKLSDLAFVRNPMLARIDSLDSLEAVGILVVESNESLTEIEMPALRQVETMLLGGYCHEIVPNQPLASVGSYPVLESVGTFVLLGQYEISSLDSLIELAERGVVFGEASFEHNYNLPQTEIDAFAAASGLAPETCQNQDDTEECPPCPPGE